MASFGTKSFIKHDDYMTPKSAWENIKQYIPQDKVIWEAFYGDGQSGNNLKELGFNVIHDKEDFFENDKGDIVVSNCPFSIKKEIYTRLFLLDKPFIIICPAAMLHTLYFNNLVKDKRLQILVPRKRIQFIKNGNETENKCNFDCFYYCWKMGFDKDLIFL